MKFNALVPELSVSNFKKSFEFYTQELGFQLEYERPGFAFLSLGSAQIMIEQVNGEWETGPLEKPYGRGINFQIEAKNIDAFFERLKFRGHRFFRELKEQSYQVGPAKRNQKEFLIVDPDGYLLRFCEVI